MGTRSVASLRSPEYEAFIRLLREERESLGVSQRALAKSLDWPQQRVNMVEAGNRRLDVAEFLQIAKCLSIDPALFFSKLMLAPDKTAKPQLD